MGYDTRLENGGKVGRVHSIGIRFGRKDGEQVKHIEQQLTIERWKLGDKSLKCGHCVVMIKVSDILLLSFQITHCLRLM
jgi:hypothetical protein